MRARNIKPGFFMNEDLAELNEGCRLLFIGLWCLADREGFLKYRPKRIWAELFPYNQDVAPCVEPWLHMLQEAGFLKFWCKPNDSEPLRPTSDHGSIHSHKELTSNSGFEGDKKGNVAARNKSNVSEPLTPKLNIVYIQIANFLEHQKPHRNEKASVIEPLTPTCVLYDKCRPDRGMRNEERGMRNEEEHSVTNSGEPDSQPAEPVEEEEPLMTIPLNKKGTFFSVFQEDINMWQDTFPGVDVLQELKRCRLWNINNRKKRKTRSGIRNHIATWLGKEQNKAGAGRSGSGRHPPPGQSLPHRAQYMEDLTNTLEAMDYAEASDDTNIGSSDQGPGVSPDALPGSRT